MSSPGSSDADPETGSDAEFSFYESTSDSERPTEDDNEDSEADSDLVHLYESFEFEDDASQTSAQPITGTALNKQTPLYSGAQLSSSQSNLLIFQYALRHGLTTKAFTELLQLISVHLPSGTHIPKSVHKLKRFMLQSFPNAEAMQHFYCGCCQRSLQSADARCTGNGCSAGDTKPCTFITVPIGPQLRRMMEGI